MSWDRNPYVYIAVAVTASVVGSLVTALLLRQWGLSAQLKVIEQKLTSAQASAQVSAQSNRGKYQASIS